VPKVFGLRAAFGLSVAATHILKVGVLCRGFGRRAFRRRRYFLRSAWRHFANTLPNKALHPTAYSARNSPVSEALHRASGGG
jgi:hypothetical protein